VIEDVLAQPHQIGDALWRIEAASVPSRPSPGGLVVCGPGGAGDLAAAALGDRASAPVGDGSPAAGTFVLCASYSGDDRSAIDCFEEAGRLGCPRAVACTAGALAARAREEGVPVIGVPGGMPPDSAVVYFLLAALECAERAGAAPSLRAEAEAAAGPLERFAGSEAGPIARALAERLRGRAPAIRGEPAIARRWQDQIAPRAGDGPPELVDLAEFEPPDAASPLQRVLSLILLGDLVAQHLGDPQP
jgi:glucose/mannose-6-phosphate isomerase